MVNNTWRELQVNGELLEQIIKDTKVNITTIPGEQYEVSIAAVNQNGEEASLEWSEEITFRAPNLIPETPEIGEVEVTSNTIQLSWNEVTTAKGYEIEIDHQIYDIDKVMTYDNTGLASESSHTYRVRAYNESGASAWSESKTAMTNEAIPGVPLNIIISPAVAASSATGSAITIQWKSIEGAESYEVIDMDGNVYVTDTAKIHIENLVPGARYEYQVRAVTNGGAGAWSSKIAIVPVITAPVNVKVVAADGIVRISWDNVGGANSYEVEMNGVTFTTTETSMDFPYNDFYMERVIKVRACKDTQISNWSQEVAFAQTLPYTLSVYNGEEFSILLPVTNIEKVSQYTLTLSFHTEELELIDAYEMTLDKELSSIYLSDFNTNIIVDQSGVMITIIISIEDYGNSSWTGIADSIRVRSKIDGTVTLQYGVTIE